MSDDMISVLAEQADRIEALEAENERLRAEGVRARTAELAWERHCKEAEAALSQIKARAALKQD